MQWICCCKDSSCYSLSNTLSTGNQQYKNGEKKLLFENTFMEIGIFHGRQIDPEKTR